MSRIYFDGKQKGTKRICLAENLEITMNPIQMWKKRIQEQQQRDALNKRQCELISEVTNSGIMVACVLTVIVMLACLFTEYAVSFGLTSTLALSATTATILLTYKLAYYTNNLLEALRLLSSLRSLLAFSRESVKQCHGFVL